VANGLRESFYLSRTYGCGASSQWGPFRCVHSSVVTLLFARSMHAPPSPAACSRDDALLLQPQRGAHDLRRLLDRGAGRQVVRRWMTCVLLLLRSIARQPAAAPVHPPEQFERGPAWPPESAICHDPHASLSSTTHNPPSCPSRGLRAWELMQRGMPALLSNGSQKTNADGSPQFTTWRLSDLDLARAMFSVRNPDDSVPMWPLVEDNRHGYVPGLRLLPQYRWVAPPEPARQAGGGGNLVSRSSSCLNHVNTSPNSCECWNHSSLVGPCPCHRRRRFPLCPVVLQQHEREGVQRDGLLLAHPQSEGLSGGGLRPPHMGRECELSQRVVRVNRATAGPRPRRSVVCSFSTGVYHQWRTTLIGSCPIIPPSPPPLWRWLCRASHPCGTRSTCATTSASATATACPAETSVHFSCIQPPVGDSGCVWGLLRGSSARMRSNEGAAANLARREHGGASGQLLTQQGPPPLRSTHRSMRRSYTSLGGTAPSTSEW
jgi:hypothetical protein